MSHHILRPNDLHGSSIDSLGRDVVPMRSRAYGLDDISGFAARTEPVIGGLAGNMSTRGYASSLEDPILISQRRDVPLGISPVPPGNPDMIYERPNSQRRVESLSLHDTESNILFVGGLPTDCTRREVGRESLSSATGSPSPVCILTKITSCEFAAEDNNFLYGFKALAEVIDQYSLADKKAI